MQSAYRLLLILLLTVLSFGETQPILSENEDEPTTDKMVFSPDGKLLLSVRSSIRVVDPVVRIWDVQKGTLFKTVETVPKGISAIQFMPDNQHIITGGLCCVLEIWDILSGKKIKSFSNTKDVWKLSICSANDLMAAMYDFPIELMLNELNDNDILDRQILEKIIDQYQEALQYLPYIPRKTIQIFNHQTGALLKTITMGEPIFHLSFSPDCHWLAVAGDGGKITLFDVEQDFDSREFVGHTDLVWHFSFSPNGNLLVSGGGDKDKTVRIWDVPSGKQLHVFKTDGFVSFVAFSIKHQKLLYRTSDVTVIDLKTFKPVTKFSFPHHIFGPVFAISPDENYLTISNHDGKITLMDLQELKSIWTIKDE